MTKVKLTNAELFDELKCANGYVYVYMYETCTGKHLLVRKKDGESVIVTGLKQNAAGVIYWDSGQYLANIKVYIGEGLNKKNLLRGVCDCFV